MDIFGIYTAIRGCIDVYSRMARATGRTATLLNQVIRGSARLASITGNQELKFCG